MLVVIDTSTDTAGLALAGDNGLFAEYAWRCGQNHSVQLLPNLALMLSRVNLNLSAASGIVVARGPGGYNGLRVGLSTAKSLAFCLNIPLVGISTLEAMAFEHAADGIPICPVINPGGSEIAAAIFQMKAGEWSRLLPEQLTSVDNLCAQIETRTAFCGQVTASTAAVLKDKLGEKAVILPPGEDWKIIKPLVELGCCRFRKHEYDDTASLQPLYLRGPSITPAKHK